MESLVVRAAVARRSCFAGERVGDLTVEINKKFFFGLPEK